MPRGGEPVTLQTSNSSDVTVFNIVSDRPSFPVSLPITSSTSTSTSTTTATSTSTSTSPPIISQPAPTVVDVGAAMSGSPLTAQVAASPGPHTMAWGWAPKLFQGRWNSLFAWGTSATSLAYAQTVRRQNDALLATNKLLLRKVKELSSLAQSKHNHFLRGFFVAALLLIPGTFLFKWYCRKSKDSPASLSQQLNDLLGSEPNIEDEPGDLSRQNSVQPGYASDQPGATHQCVICVSATPSQVLLPCRHLCICARCVRHIERFQNQCPICRKYIERVIHVYLP
eukprot:GFYU01009907.1.p1 GENE.GFYU01009907.1~~GFYU01009907.1.p1  ORF type:complete len:283 (-),score=-1.60 GFYU01009907.1:196-1044(-)